MAIVDIPIYHHTALRGPIICEVAFVTGGMEADFSWYDWNKFYTSVDHSGEGNQEVPMTVTFVRQSLTVSTITLSRLLSVPAAGAKYSSGSW